MKNSKSTMAKPIYISFRTTEKVKQVLDSLAKKGYRTLSQQCEMAIIEWLREQGHLKEKTKK